MARPAPRNATALGALRPSGAAAAALLGALAAACSSKSPAPPSAAEVASGGGAPSGERGGGAGGAAPAAPGPFRVATFNAGLAVGYLPLAEERAPRVIEALARAPVDLLCVQEFWLDEHWEALRAAAAPRFPHAYRLPAAPGATPGPACSRGELGPVVACAREHCKGAAGGGLGGCVVRHCAHLAREVSAACVNCLIGHPVGALEQITAACAAPPAAGPSARAAPRDPPAGAPPNRAAPREAAAGAPRARAEVVAYGGSFGTGVLSREPLLERDALAFEATLNPRAALYARVRASSLGDVHVVCTHLTPALGAPLGSGRSPAAEQRAQVEGLLRWVEQKAAGGGPVVLAGDLNAGPRAGEAVEPLLPEHYAKFLAAGFRNPYASRPDASCTFCRSNPLNGGAGAGGTLLDHVLLRGFAGEASAGPFLREPVAIEVGGEARRTAYSDHYGLIVTLGPGGGG